MVSEVHTGAGEQVNRRVNGTGLTLGSIARSGTSGDGRIMGAEVEVGEFWKLTEGGLMRRSWIDGSEERMWKSRVMESLG